MTNTHFKIVKIETYRAVGEPWWRSPDLSVLTRTIAHHFGVDSTGNTVMELGIKLR